MKLLLINSLYSPNIVGGAERSVQFLAEAMVRLGHDVAVACLTPGDSPVTEFVSGVRVHYLPLTNLLWPFGADGTSALKKAIWHGIDTRNPVMARKLGKILDREKPDLVHTNNLTGFSSLAWKVIKNRGYPLVHTLRDYGLMCPRSTMYKAGGNCTRQCASCLPYAMLRRSLSTLPDAAIGNSRFILNKHIDAGFFKEVKIRSAIANIYEPKVNMTRERPKNAAPLRLGFLGQITEIKGIKPLLEVVAGYSQDIVTLNIGGNYNTAFGNSLRQKFNTENIKFLGYIDPSEFLQGLDFLVVPSLWHEPLPRTIFEAYGHGVPVLSSDTGGSPEIVDEGRTGFVYQADDSEALRKSVEKILREKPNLNNMSSACLAKAKDFSAVSIVSDYEAIYQCLCKNRE